MSHTIEKEIQEFHQFLAKKAPQGPKDEDELQRLMDEFFMQHTEIMQDADDEIVPMDVYEYLDMADRAATKRKKKEYYTLNSENGTKPNRIWKH